MKKLLLGLIIIAALAVYLFKTQPNTSAVKQNLTPASHIVQPKIKKQKQLNEPSPQERVVKLKHEISLCKNKSADKTSKIMEMNQSLTSFFKSELNKGTPVADLLVYSGLYKASYQSYTTLLKEAIRDKQKKDYKIIESIAILADWQGIEVIQGFDSDKVKEVVQQLGSATQSPAGFTFKVPLDKNVKKETLYALLNNSDTFTTYSQSFIRIEGSNVISPATLFMLNANKLSIDEFKHVTAANKFTVNELAVAINNGLPNEYIFTLMKQVPSLNDMPIYDNFTVLYNLADLAVSQYNLPLLKALKQAGVTPTNEAGLFTALDIAIINLPKNGNLALGSLDKINTDMLDYLIAEGYKAHGNFEYKNSSDKALLFENKFMSQQGVFISELKNPLSYLYFSKIPIIENSMLPQVTEPDSSEISQFLQEIQDKKEELDSTLSNCSQLPKKLFVAQKLIQDSDAYAKVREIEKEYGSNFEKVLQDIDPVLVNYWWNTIDRHTSSDRSDSVFREYLAKKEFQKALEYSQTTPLNQTETNVLFTRLLENPYDLVPIWNSRTLPIPPTNLVKLSWFPLEQWQKLKQAGFDFSITDTYGRDVYVQAASSSVETVQFLIDNKIPADSEKLGVDILDLALEQSYTKGELSPMIPLALQLVEKIEPNHLSRAARLKTFYPEVYEQLIKLNPALKPAEGTQLNHYTFNNL
ncbi:cupric reductase [Pseudoalteromonas distincta]|uniref:cupric reductase n=1 Tax=Pseudoalteromonas distincta TaxID=77608 RepID=UPI0023421208|nr:cupric reductase [Pseudoalteromonas distincta]MDC3214275.1 cupric reductase [Pseudoalteromonas distincta]